MLLTVGKIVDFKEKNASAQSFGTGGFGTVPDHETPLPWSFSCLVRPETTKLSRFSQFLWKKMCART